jgi:hypothetical protein
MPQPNDLFKYWRADQVAECMEGVTDALYITLWSDIVPLQSEEFQETPERDFEAIVNYWHLLSESNQRLLNTIAVNHQAELDAYKADTIFCHLSPAE